MDTDKLWKILDGVQAQIRAYDTKAQIVVGIDAALLGFLSTQAGAMATAVATRGFHVSTISLIATGVACLVLLLVSLAHAILTVYPRLKLGQPRSRIFFVHLAEDFGRDYAAARQDLVAMNDEALQNDVANQIQANSLVCQAKSNRFAVGLLTMAMGLVLWCSTLVLHFSVQHLVASPGSKPSTGAVYHLSIDVH